MALWVLKKAEFEVSAKVVERAGTIEQQIEMPRLEKKRKSPRCCLCNAEMSSRRVVIEQRPTAEDGSMQEWFYCPGCWIDLRNLREPAKSQ